jgi:hypothetical protein
LSKPKNSLVRNCYDALKLSKDKCSMKLNWYRDFSKLLDTYGCSELTQNEPVIDYYCTVNSIRTEITIKLAVVRESLIQNDILKMQSSIKMPFYKTIRTHCKRDELFTSNTNWNCIVVLVQIRSNMPSIKYKNKRVTFNAIKTYFGNNFQDTNDKCTVCSLNRSETLFVMMIYYHGQSGLIKMALES